MISRTHSRSARALAAVLLVAASVACTRTLPAESPAGEPYVRGVVQSVTPQASGARIVVTSGDGCGISGNTDADTRFLRRTGGGVQTARLADVQVGGRVAVYVTGPLTRSCPPIGRISTMIIEPD